MKRKGLRPKISTEKTYNYLHYIELPLKIVSCWDWFPNLNQEYQVIINGVYLCFVLFTISKIALELCVHLYTEWLDIMSSLDQIADSLPLVVSIAIISYYAVYREELYELMRFMNFNFKYHSAKGVTNMTMSKSCKAARRFASVYTACTMFSVTMYATLPVLIHLWTGGPIQSWFYKDVTRTASVVLTFLHSLIAQCFVGLAMGQFGVFFATNSILICGQLDLLCCSLRNVRHTALLLRGVSHAVLQASASEIRLHEHHGYLYNYAEMQDSEFHYDEKIAINVRNVGTEYDIYSPEYDEATVSALRACAQLCQLINEYKKRFEEFVSPLLVLRVVQVTLYLCVLLYTATLKFDMVTVEYLAAVALDIFVYCYYGNQIILQADRVSTAAYTSSWAAMGVRPRRVLLSLLLANRRPALVRAGRFLPMDLHTFVVIIKTSFSYYTLLVNVNEK